jgi:hypothetical protein
VYVSVPMRVILCERKCECAYHYRVLESKCEKV